MQDTQISVGNIIRGNAEQRPDDVAIVYDGRRITWAQHYERACRIAAALAAAGVGPQDRVAFLDKNGPEFFETQFGASLLNAVTVPVNWRLAPPEIEYTVNDSSAKVLVVLAEDDEINWISLRNLPTVHLLASGQLNTYDVLVADEVVFTAAALDEFLGVRQETEQ